MVVRQIAYRIYEKSLIKGITGSAVPRCIALVISDGDLVDNRSVIKLLNFIEWCCELGVREVSVYISITFTQPGTSGRNKLIDCVYGLFQNAGFPGNIVADGSINQIKGDKPCTVTISIGYGGKHELTNAMRDIMKEVKSGKIRPEEINEKVVEDHLIFKCEPDLFIRTGEARLTDFLLWQAVYSELYFTDVNWEDFRKIDLLRAIRDYQYRQRRFGA
ncbi:di-trans,poly-cis-decaprenylcistransferase [Methanocella sp. CWC-04]|uniref:Di-trans,poly-cis-decaprenylcistransferase n=1 Tax=Methanooceanicella nereidis TaxID=2052831 RepID=A0AAP2RFB6_9EURY|nr:polyprenyl diphosphate synthase [Methanocella sp. CWC-04]MCD1296273.1 di-trans,poly-cis-decaprenylcistransferase [Methanocella sp. CWC-04]